MSKIHITNLQPAGSELFQGSESFLTELQPTAAHAIYGGKNKNKSGSKKKSGSNNNSGSSKNKSGSNNNSGSSNSPSPFHCY